MKIDVSLNIFDAVEILRQALSTRFGCEIGRIEVKSWKQVVFNADLPEAITDGGYVHAGDLRHVIRIEHSEMFKPPNPVDVFDEVPE